MKKDILSQLQGWRRAGRACALVTEIGGGRAVLLDGNAHTGDLILSGAQHAEVIRRIAADLSGRTEDGLFIRIYVPPTRMVIVGAVHIAKALVPMATVAGFAVTLIDPREAFVQAAAQNQAQTIVAWPDEAMADLRPDRRTAIVTLTHDPKLDDPALCAALRSDAFYIGALGSRKTHAKRLERLRVEGFSDPELARIHGPVGLAINAVSPAEIAVSILGQVVQTLRAVRP